MSCRAKSSSKSIKFQPMPMAALIANLKTLPATLNYRDSSDSSDESSSSIGSSSMKPALDDVKKVTPIPKSSSVGNNKENVCRKSRYFDRVHVLPTIEASTTTSQALPAEIIPKRVATVEKKDSARCLFPEPTKEPAPKETPKEAPRQTSKETPKQTARSAPKESPKQTAKLAPKETPQHSPKLKPVGPMSEFIPEPSRSQSTQQTQQTGTVAATPSQPQGPRNNGKIQFKTINIKGKKYMILKKLGVGGSSQVYKVLEISTSTEYAVKCVDLATDREMAQGYLNEVKVLRDLQKSDRVVTLYEYEYDRPNNYLRLVLEAGETDLACFLRAHRDGAPPALVLHYWEEMLRAVQQIHQHGIVHADLKPANFLLVSGRLKLIDFGIASAVSSDATSVVRSCGKGTFSYISPEALGGDGSQPLKVSFYSDIWSLGCILYSLVYGHTPFAHLATMVKLVTIRDPNHYIGYPPVDNLPPSLITALKQCLRYNARSRPTATDLLLIKYLSHNTQSIPEALLTKIQAHVTPEEYVILQNAMVKIEP